MRRICLYLGPSIAAKWAASCGQGHSGGSRSTCGNDVVGERAVWSGRLMCLDDNDDRWEYRDCDGASARLMMVVGCPVAGPDGYRRYTAGRSQTTHVGDQQAVHWRRNSACTCARTRCPFTTHSSVVSCPNSIVYYKTDNNFTTNWISGVLSNKYFRHCRL